MPPPVYSATQGLSTMSAAFAVEVRTGRESGRGPGLETHVEFCRDRAHGRTPRKAPQTAAVDGNEDHPELEYVQ